MSTNLRRIGCCVVFPVYLFSKLDKQLGEKKKEHEVILRQLIFFNKIVV